MGAPIICSIDRATEEQQMNERKYTNFAISRYGVSRFEVQGDVRDGGWPWRRTVQVAVFATLAQAERFVAEQEAE